MRLSLEKNLTRDLSPRLMGMQIMKLVLKFTFRYIFIYYLNISVIPLQNGWSPLLVASEQGHINIVKILLQHHARVDVFDEVCVF